LPAKRKILRHSRDENAAGNAFRHGTDRAVTIGVSRFLVFGAAAIAVLTIGHTQGTALERLQLQVSPAVSMAPASVMVRAIVEHDSENRQLEIIADSESFYRRTVVDLDGAQAPKINELRLIDIPGGEYDVIATLYDSRGARTLARRSITVMSANGR
jgi:hypothetical protein